MSRFLTVHDCTSSCSPPPPPPRDGTLDAAMDTASRVHVALGKESMTLTQADTIRAFLWIRNRCERWRRYCVASNLGIVLENESCKLRIQAERAMGRDLHQSVKRGGDKRSDAAKLRPNITDFGLTYKQSSRYRQLAKVPDHVVNEYFVLMKLGLQRASSNGLLQFAKRLSE